MHMQRGRRDAQKEGQGPLSEQVTTVWARHVRRNSATIGDEWQAP